MICSGQVKLATNVGGIIATLSEVSDEWMDRHNIAPVSDSY